VTLRHAVERSAPAFCGPQLIVLTHKPSDTDGHTRQTDLRRALGKWRRIDDHP